MRTVGAREQRWSAFGAAVLLAVVGAAVALRTMLRVNVDVAWLLTVGEKVLDGQRLYVDILETNPPASVLIYWPAILLARMAGAAPERVLDILVFASTGLSLWLASRALAGAGLLRGLAVWFLAPCAAAVLLVVPLDNIAQREHIAVICLLPALAVMAARAERSAPKPWLAIIAGLGAGITVAIKPHFLLGLVLPEIYVLLRLRSLRSALRLENLVAAAVVLGYGVLIVAAFPAFLTEMLPLLRDVYLPVRHYDVVTMLRLPATPIWLATGAALALCVRPRDWEARIVVPFLASAGFLAALVLQGKGWSYHGYPAVALAFLTAALVMAQKIGDPGARRPGMIWRTVDIAAAAGFAFMVCWGTPWFRDGRNLGTLTSVLAGLTPHPKLIAVSSDLAIGHPLVREIGGSWVGSVCSQWITGGVAARRDEDLDEATRARLEAHAARDKHMLAADIRQHRPDIILIHLDWYDWMKWILSDPDLVDALSQYRRGETVGEVAIWARAENHVAGQDLGPTRTGAGERPSVEASR